MPDEPYAKDSTDPAPFLASGRTREMIIAATIAENRRRCKEAGIIVPEGRVQPIPPDGPIHTEQHYLTVRDRRDRFVARRRPDERDLNGAPIANRIAYMEVGMRMWDGMLSLDVLRAYEQRIREIKGLLRSPWPKKWGPEMQAQAERQRELRRLKRRVTDIYAARRHYRS